MFSGRIKRLYAMLLVILIFAAGCRGAEALQQPQDGLEPTPTLAMVGSSAEKPVPYGYDIMLKDVVLRVDEIIRADRTTLTNQDGKAVLGEEQEFLLVRITSQCIKPGQDKCRISPLDYQVLDSTGKPILAENSLVGLDELLTITEISSGVSQKGMLAFRVEKEKDYSLLTFSQTDGAAVYLSLAY